MSSLKIVPLKGHNSAEFLLVWSIANTVALLLGPWLGGEIIGILWPTPWASPGGFIDSIVINPVPRLIVVGVTTGALMGFLQGVVLRWFSYEMGWVWVASSMLACVVFPAFREIVDSPGQFDVTLGTAILGGVTLGIAQWRILRRMVRKAGWWILAVVLVSPFLFGMIRPNPAYSPDALLSGIVVGGVTGIALSILLRQPVGYEGETSLDQMNG